VIISLEKLRNYDFSLSNINIFHQKPTYRHKRIHSRGYNGFLYILHGQCQYLFQDEGFTLSPGSLVYLPKGSDHTLIVDSPVFEFYRIDFQLAVNGEPVLFHDSPLKCCHSATPELAETIQTLADRYEFAQDTVAKTALLCRIFQCICDLSVNPRQEKLAPAVAYLLEHMTEKVSCQTLAQLCSLSSAQFYNLFHQEYQKTPLEYRDSLRMRRATLLLRDGTFPVAEIAEALGFESVSYFSRFFKKHKGISPSEYMKQKTQGKSH
jgi:AraC-like DNA-binding protein